MKETYSSELLEDLEAIEIKGGFGVHVTHPGQCGCVNTAKGCGSGVEQMLCTNKVDGCGALISLCTLQGVATCGSQDTGACLKVQVTPCT